MGSCWSSAPIVDEVSPLSSSARHPHHETGPQHDHNSPVVGPTTDTTATTTMAQFLSKKESFKHLQESYSSDTAVVAFSTSPLLSPSPLPMSSATASLVLLDVEEDDHHQTDKMKMMNENYHIVRKGRDSLAVNGEHHSDDTEDEDDLPPLMGAFVDDDDDNDDDGGQQRWRQPCCSSSKIEGPCVGTDVSLHSLCSSSSSSCEVIIVGHIVNTTSCSLNNATSSVASSSSRPDPLLSPVVRNQSNAEQSRHATNISTSSVSKNKEGLSSAGDHSIAVAIADEFSSPLNTVANPENVPLKL